MNEPAPVCLPILCVALTPARQRTLEFDALQPGGVNRARRVSEKASGKGNNVAAILHRLGNPVLLLGLSAGATGSYIERETEREGIPAEWIRTPGETRVCHTLINHASGEVTELVEEAPPIPAETRDHLLRRFTARLEASSAVALSGKPPPGPAEDLYAELAERAAAASVPVFLDSQGPGLLRALDHQPFLAKLNQHELAATLGLPDDGEEATLARGAFRLMDLGARHVLVTRGREGACLFEPGRAWRIHSPPIRALNPIGSGDAAMAGLLHGRARGWPLAESAAFGAACGAAGALALASGDLDPAQALGLQPHAKVEPLSANKKGI